METINYQGQEIQATRVNYISGHVTTSTVDCEGDEELFRDEEGCYYLRRKLNLLDSEGADPQEASGRTLVHRINVNAAILWATTRVNSETLDLRNDAAKLLMEGRGYIDPNPVHLSASQRQELAATGEASARMVEVARLRQRRDEIETRMDEIDAGAVDASVGSLRRERNAINERIEALEGLGDGGPLLTFTLDTYGSTLVRRALAEGDAAKGIDIVNGALRYTLGADDDHNWPEEAKKAAARREAQSPSGVRRDAIPASASQPTPGFADLNERCRQLLSVHLAENPEVDARDVLNGAVDFFLADPESDDPVLGGSWDAEECARLAKQSRLKQEATGKHHVAFSVWLTEEQMSEGLRVNFPAFAIRPLRAYFSASVPMEGSPSLTVDGKIQVGHGQAVQRRRESTLVNLDEEADKLVRRYLKVTPWEFTAADIINACVVHAMEQAFDNVATVALEGELDAEEYDDSGWGYVEEDIVAATLRRTGKEAVDQRSDWSKRDAEAELEPEMTEYSTGLNKVRSGLNLPLRGSRGAKPNSADVALLAASAPEEEPLPEEAHTDELEEGTATPDEEEGK